MTGLYPPIDCHESGFLRVDDVHALYYEQSGNPAGVPVLFLHGGPGAGSAPKHRQFFDPRHYRIVMFDQRGSGRSTPLGELKDNTPQHLAGDIERLRAHLKVDRWHVFGGSWGSTLALFYAIHHPACVLSLTLRGIFMMRQQELDWFLSGMGLFFPGAWEKFSSFIPESERGDLLRAYYTRLTNPDPAVHLPAARSWSLYESSCARLLPPTAEELHSEDPAASFSIARMECHYFVRNRFAPDDFILQNISAIRHIPAVIVQGRYDVICPPASAYALHQAWPEARLIIVPDAGHSSSEPGITAALVDATNRFRAIPS